MKGTSSVMCHFCHSSNPWACRQWCSPAGACSIYSLGNLFIYSFCLMLLASSRALLNSLMRLRGVLSFSYMALVSCRIRLQTFYVCGPSPTLLLPAFLQCQAPQKLRSLFFLFTRMEEERDNLQMNNIPLWLELDLAMEILRICLYYYVCAKTSAKKLHKKQNSSTEDDWVVSA